LFFPPVCGIIIRMQGSIKKTGATQAFTLIQVSILLTVAALVMVAVLPGFHTTLDANAITTARMNTVFTALREYQAANGVLPCPADATQPMGSASYGVATSAAWNGSPGINCATSNYTDSTNFVAIGMVPVRSLGLSNDYALDGYGHDITYAVDMYAAADPDLYLKSSTNANGGYSFCWPPNFTYAVAPATDPSVSAWTPHILVSDNGVVNRTAVALVSHGADGHGAWIPLNGASGTATQLNAGSTDTDQLLNAHLQSSGAFPNPTTSSLVTDAAGANVTFVKKPPTSTFDDLVVYKSSLWNINQYPSVLRNAVIVSPPPNANYVMGEALNFSAVFPGVVTVTTTGITNYPSLYFYADYEECTPNCPFLWGRVNGTHGVAAYYTAGTGTNALNFKYTVGAADYASGAGYYGLPVIPVIGGGKLIASGSNACFSLIPWMNVSSVLNGVGGGSGVTVGAPSGIAVSGSTVWVVDTLNQRFQNCSTAGSCSAAYSSSAMNPSGIAVDSNNNVWVASPGNGVGYTTLYTAASSYATGSNLSNSSGGTIGMAYDAGGYVWNVDTINHGFFACSTTSPYTCNSSYGTGRTSGLFMSNPTGIAVDSSENVYVMDAGNARILKFACPGGTCGGGSVFFNSVSSGSGQFNAPTHMAVDGYGNIWVADSGNNRIQEFNSSGAWLLTIGGGAVSSSSSCSCASGNGALYFNNPTGIAFDSSNNLYVVDNSNNRVVILQYNAIPSQSYKTTTAFGSYGTGVGSFNF